MNQVSFFSVDELPRQIKVFQHIVDLKAKEENLYDSVAFWGEPLLNNLFALSNETYECLLFICNYTFAIINYCFFLFSFDSQLEFTNT